MAEVTQRIGQTTYNITGLTTLQAAVLHALLGQMRVDNLTNGMYGGLDTALRKDPDFVPREVVRRNTNNYYDPPVRLPIYYTRAVGGSDEGWG